MLKLLKKGMAKTKPVATDLFFSFKDEKISREQYEFLKERLDNYMFHIHEEYHMESEIVYDEPSETIIMGINIIIPDRLIPSNSQMKAQMFVDIINGFPEFYENEKNK